MKHTAWLIGFLGLCLIAWLGFGPSVATAPAAAKPASSAPRQLAKDVEHPMAFALIDQADEDNERLRRLLPLATEATASKAANFAQHRLAISCKAAVPAAALASNRQLSFLCVFRI